MKSNHLLYILAFICTFVSCKKPEDILQKDSNVTNGKSNARERGTIDSTEY